MGNCGSSGDGKLKKSEVDELHTLLKKTDTSIDFYKRFDGVYKYDGNLSPSRARGVLKVANDVLVSDNKFKHKFFALAFANLLASKYESARSALGRSSLVQVLLDQLPGEAASVREVVGAKRVRSWRERYFVLAVETLAAVDKGDAQHARKAHAFLGAQALDVPTFYSTLSYSRIREVQADIGELSREQADERGRRAGRLLAHLRGRARRGGAEHDERHLQRL